MYTMAVGSLVSSSVDKPTLQKISVALIAVFLVATIAYFALRAPKPVRLAHLILSPMAFMALAYPIGAPLLDTWFVGWIATLAQIFVALLAWLIAPTEQPE